MWIYIYIHILEKNEFELISICLKETKNINYNINGSVDAPAYDEEDLLSVVLESGENVVGASVVCAKPSFGTGLSVVDPLIPFPVVIGLSVVDALKFPVVIGLSVVDPLNPFPVVIGLSVVDPLNPFPVVIGLCVVCVGPLLGFPGFPRASI